MIAARLFVALTAIALIAAATGIASWRVAPARRFARASTVVAFVLSLATWLVRWYEAEHLPLFGTWESALSLALFVLAFGALSRRVAEGIAPLVAGVVLLHGGFYDSTVYALTISERSLVVDAHALLAWVAFASLSTNAAIGVAVLLRRDDSAATALSRTLAIGFFFYSAMIASGAIYKFMLFGVAWSFDPIETLAVTSWLAYATLLHLHLIAKWEGVRLAQWCVGLFVLLVVSYRAIVFFPPISTYHIFDIDLRIHVSGGAPR